MANPIRLRAQLDGDKATVRVLITHAMESGQRKDAAGQLIAAWYIEQITASHNGKEVLRLDWGPSVSKNPSLQFVVKGAQAGDTIAVSWRDNRGDTRSDETTVS